MGESSIDKLKAEIEGLEKKADDVMEESMQYEYEMEKTRARIRETLEEWEQKTSEIRSKIAPPKFAYFTFVPCWILSYAALVFFIPGSEYHTTPMLIATIIWAILEIVNAYICIRCTARGDHLRIMALYLIVFHLPYVGIYIACTLPSKIGNGWANLYVSTHQSYSKQIKDLESQYQKWKDKRHEMDEKYEEMKRRKSVKRREMDNLELKQLGF